MSYINFRKFEQYITYKISWFHEQLKKLDTNKYVARSSNCQKYTAEIIKQEKNHLLSVKIII